MFTGLLFVAVHIAGCVEPPDPRFLPDEVLREELGLTDADRVHTVTVRGGESEAADPTTDSVPAGAFVQFVTGDWLTHEILFDTASLSAEQRDFLTVTDQLASPPLVHLDARFVVSFESAPPGRYPYQMLGNGAPGDGLIIVTDVR